jgi:hypothetical protein
MAAHNSDGIVIAQLERVAESGTLKFPLKVSSKIMTQ